MTIKQIAELATSGETTIRRWAEKASAKMADISAKMAKARETSVAADFTLPETIAIIRAGGNDTLADLLAENAKKPSHGAAQIDGIKAKLNGKQMEVYLRAAIHGVITKAEFKAALGIRAELADAVTAIVPRAELPAPNRNPDAVAAALRPLTLLSPKVQRNMLGAGYAQAKREEEKQAQWDQNGKLFGDEARA
jgi:hypothetical protein